MPIFSASSPADPGRRWQALRHRHRRRHDLARRSSVCGWYGLESGCGTASASAGHCSPEPLQWQRGVDRDDQRQQFRSSHWRKLRRSERLVQAPQHSFHQRHGARRRQQWSGHGHHCRRRPRQHAVVHSNVALPKLHRPLPSKRVTRARLGPSQLPLEPQPPAPAIPFRW